MGASGWKYFEDYVEDVHAAFEGAQKRVLESGDFYKPAHAYRGDPSVASGDEIFMAQMLEGLEEGLLYADDEEVRAALEKERDALRAALGEEVADGSWRGELAKVRAMAREDGTHSILDMSGVTQKNSRGAFGTVRLLDEGEVERLYDTNKPTREVIEATGAGFDCQRWSGIAHLVYDDAGEPTHWFFGGVSGD